MFANKRIVGTVWPYLGTPACLTEFTKSLAQMVRHSLHYVCGPDGDIDLQFPAHSFHDLARNQIARSFQGEWLFMLDTDHAFEPDLLARLVRVMYATGARVVTGLYLHRGGEHAPVLWTFDEGGKAHGYAGWPEGEILQVDCAGAGCLLIHREVFRRIRHELGEEPFSRLEAERGHPGGVVGEDFAFFRRLKRLDIPVACPTFIECPHLEIHPLRYKDDFDPTSVRTRETPQKVLQAQE